MGFYNKGNGEKSQSQKEDWSSQLERLLTIIDDPGHTVNVEWNAKEKGVNFDVLAFRSQLDPKSILISVTKKRSEEVLGDTHISIHIPSKKITAFAPMEEIEGIPCPNPKKCLAKKNQQKALYETRKIVSKVLTIIESEKN